MRSNQMTSVMGINRFHTTIWSITLHFVLMQEACNPTHTHPKGKIVLNRILAATGDHDLRFTSGDTLARAKENKYPGSIMFDLVPRRYDHGIWEGHEVFDLVTLSYQTIEAFFALAAEKAYSWIKENRPTEIPPVTNFARVVRNAIAHGGTINIGKHHRQTVTWRGVSYDHTCIGRQIRLDLQAADLIFLIFDLDAELHSIGAPCPLR